MKLAHGFIVLLASASSSALAAATECPALPVATAEGAICLAELLLVTSASQTYALKYQAEEHESYWFVVHWPKDSNVRGGGGKLRIEKATGRVAFVEGYR